MTQIDRTGRSGADSFLIELREAARRQGNVIFALIFREIKTRSGGASHGLLSLVAILVEPVLVVISISAFFYLLRRQEVQGIHIALFLAVSYPPFMFFRRCITSVPRALAATRSFYAYHSVKPFDAVVARYIIEMVLTLVGAAGLLFLLWWFMDLAIRRDDLLQGFALVGTLLAGNLGMALLLGVYGTRFPVINKTVTLLGRGMVLLSAVIHPVGELSPEATAIILWNPIAHFEELFRSALLGMTPHAEISYGYFAMWAMCALFLGFVGYYVNRFKVLER